MGTCSCLASDIKLSHVDPNLFLNKGITPLPLFSIKMPHEQKTARSIQTVDSTRKSMPCMQMKEQLNINITLLGGIAVGKSTFAIRYNENSYDKLYIPSIRNETRTKHVIFNNRPYDIIFNVMINSIENDLYLYERIDFFFIIFDLTSASSFKEAKSIYKNDVNCYHNKNKDEFNNVYFLGNKVDLKERSVLQTNINKFIQKYNIKYFDVSVKLRFNMSKILNEVVELFDCLAFSQSNNNENRE